MFIIMEALGVVLGNDCMERCHMQRFPVGGMMERGKRCHM
jgi:hypothetical protein